MLNGTPPMPMPASMLKASPTKSTPVATEYDDEGESSSEAADDTFEVEQKAVNFTNWLLVCCLLFRLCTGHVLVFFI